MSEKSERFDIEKFPKKIMNSLDTVMIVLDSDGNIVWVNDRWKEITELENGKVLGRSINEVLKDGGSCAQCPDEVTFVKDDGSCSQCPDKVTFALKVICSTNYGKVLMAHRTNGFEHACNTFNGVVGENKTVIERIRKSWSRTEVELMT